MSMDNFIEKVKEKTEKAIERTKEEINKLKPGQLKDAVDTYEADIKKLEEELESLRVKKIETELKLEQKKEERKIAIKKLKKMK